MTRDEMRAEFELYMDRSNQLTVTTTSAVLFAEAMARKAAKAERARCIRAIQRMPVPIDQADGAMRAIAAIEALNETEDTP